MVKHPGVGQGLSAGIDIIVGEGRIRASEPKTWFNRERHRYEEDVVSVRGVFIHAS